MSATATREVTMVEALNVALADAMAADDRVCLFGQDIGRYGGVFRVTAGLLDRFGPDRVTDTPISEAGTVGLAVGLCLAGFKPVVEVQFDAFAYPAFEQLAAHVARYRWRTNGAVDVPIVLRVPFGGGVGAPELHSESPEALFCHVPGLRVVCPSDATDAYSLLRWAIDCPDPVVFMEPKRRYRGERSALEPYDEAFEAARLRTVLRGCDVTVVTYGPMVAVCRAAAKLVPWVNVELLDLRSLWPLDEAALLASARRTRRCVIVHEAPRSCGVGAEVSAVLAEHALLELDAPIRRVTGADTPFPLAVHEDQYMPSAEAVAAAIDRAANC